VICDDLYYGWEKMNLKCMGKIGKTVGCLLEDEDETKKYKIYGGIVFKSGFKNKMLK